VIQRPPPRSLQPGIDRFRLKREHREDGLVYGIERLAGDEALQRLEAQRVFAQRERLLAAENAVPQPIEVPWLQVLGTVDDPQGRCDAAIGAIVGGRYTSQRGSTAKRLITSSAAAAFSSRTVSQPISAVSTVRRPSTSPRSSTPGSRPVEAGASGRTGSYQTCSAGTETSSRSG
jgi:hypothetical protein